ncbi:RagB/SusD family nutrient uptake outer membrane protein [Pedobacter sp. PLR]|uniref:RagB/SusD family nutrient uptake outer membrane protein n=1 Tax=Pedobacter sp. PLR TaxID=2994465 RepID=UPI00224646FE|nr:RagB/SusD family nutrient uptake outer membrane protein [Pedobacter sp. PLR]MCX2449943.1 RagB/SusD family nutrient uptake outer membrane protein [Pedobacter sp. PLR]
MKKFILLLSSCMLIITINGCKKDFLNAKPSTNIVQPITLEDFQLLLDNTNLNYGVGMGVLAADEYQYSSDATWLSAPSVTARNSYIWAKDIYEGTITFHWSSSYQAIFYANNVLTGVEKIERTPKNAVEWDRIKGWALFLRAYSFYDLVNNFAPFYNEKTAAKDLGIPLRLNPSIDEILPRSSVEIVFERIFKDLDEATTLLNTALPTARSRPSKVAAHALLAKIYLNMGKYNQAESNADVCLGLYSKLIDYNTLSKTSSTPFVNNHDEQIYARIATIENAIRLGPTNNYIQVAPDLMALYGPNDLRLSVFYSKQTDGTYDIKRSYYGVSGAMPFVGLATDEIYLIKAECLARRGEVQPSMDVLNKLLITRWNPKATSPEVPYKNVMAANSMEALDKVLLERRKELVFRGSRWDDLRRFNRAGANITLRRTINGQTYSLPPNDPRSVFPIPDDEVNLSGIQQNSR